MPGPSGQTRDIPICRASKRRRRYKESTIRDCGHFFGSRVVSPPRDRLPARREWQSDRTAWTTGGRRMLVAARSERLLKALGARAEHKISRLPGVGAQRSTRRRVPAIRSWASPPAPAAVPTSERLWVAYRSIEDAPLPRHQMRPEEDRERRP